MNWHIRGQKTDLGLFAAFVKVGSGVDIKQESLNLGACQSESDFNLRTPEPPFTSKIVIRVLLPKNLLTFSISWVRGGTKVNVYDYIRKGENITTDDLNKFSHVR